MGVEVRETKLVAWFFWVVGAGMSLLGAWAAVTLEPPSPTKSLLSKGLAHLLETALGKPAGHLAYHLFWTALGAGIAYLALRVLRDHSR